MSLLAIIACLIGGALILSGVIGLAVPAGLRRVMLAFPRSRVMAWVLTAADLAWVTWIIHSAYLGRFEVLRPAIYIGAPIAFLLIVFFVDELLAPRALGGLLLLLANPVLNAARWHESAWRLVVTVIAYAWVVAGIVLVLSPYRFRHVAEFVTKTESRCRAAGAIRLAAGAAILFLGLKVY